MIFSKKKKQQRRQHLERVQSALAGPKTITDRPGEPKLPQTEVERQALVEQRIQEAMANGAFDDLPGKGKPLDLNSNPYLTPGQELAFGLLKNNGYAPDWIERDQEIRRELAEIQSKLQTAWRQRRANPAGELSWQAAVARFEVRLEKLNRKIDDFNLVVPIISKQRARLRLATELRRVTEAG